MITIIVMPETIRTFATSMVLLKAENTFQIFPKFFLYVIQDIYGLFYPELNFYNAVFYN